MIDSTQGPKLEARSAEALHKDRQEDLAAYKIPPSQLSDEESQGLGVDYKIGFKLATTGRMLEVWATHERNSTWTQNTTSESRQFTKLTLTWSPNSAVMACTSFPGRRGR